MQDLPVTGVIPVSEMRGGDEQETAFLREMEQEARAFLASFGWCGEIKELYFGEAVGRLASIFFAQIVPTRAGVDEWLWLFVGDIPPAYLVITWCKTPDSALQSYLEEMRKWVAAARKSQTSREIIPVNAAPTPENAELLSNRLNELEKMHKTLRSPALNIRLD